ncbi:MAG: 4-(cytidine 5'-diphospho)-2-C-methyl-D-erythritol kinase, partial [Clostridia bacterium]|nr:4-(cytidine 5'-diphospho)-2-C-methyl-D-erythritol kinase [Clostridia bacterium]
TGEMFSRLDALTDRTRPNTAAVLAALQAGDLPRAARGFVNAISPLWENEATHALREAFTEAGALAVSLTGAGPTLFATFADEEAARRCQAALNTPTLLCRPTQKSILFE